MSISSANKSATTSMLTKTTVFLMRTFFLFSSFYFEMSGLSLKADVIWRRHEDDSKTQTFWLTAKHVGSYCAIFFAFRTLLTWWTAAAITKDQLKFKRKQLSVQKIILIQHVVRKCIQRVSICFVITPSANLIFTAIIHLRCLQSFCKTSHCYQYTKRKHSWWLHLSNPKLNRKKEDSLVDRSASLERLKLKSGNYEHTSWRVTFRAYKYIFMSLSQWNRVAELKEWKRDDLFDLWSTGD